mmetsp:Transcript_93196/g.240841  ORF Transcript_93196/g.240841 Transcript_93196/m.240841 type:complete len:187 (+) Transcript_93196:68-628(+)
MPRARSSYNSGSRSGPYTRSSTGLYTSSGAPIRNAAAYAATGARTYTTAGRSVKDPVAYSGAVESSRRQNTDTPKYLYHYTTADSAASIRDSGYMRGSRGPSDAALGEGTYLTAKPPRSSTESLLKNNYDSGAHAVDASRVEAYVRVDAERVRAVSGRADLGRDVWVVPGKQLGLARAGGVVRTRR